MNKKLFQLLIAAVTTLFSVGVLAQSSTTLNNDTNVGRVTTGGTVVMEDQVVVLGVHSAGHKVVMKLPTGFAFSGTPTATATGATVTLEDSAGDPTLNGFVTLSEGNTRASVTLDSASTAADSITFKGSVTYSGSAGTADLGIKNASIFIETSTGGTIFLDSDNAVAQVVTASAAASPIAIQSTTTSITVPNSTNAALTTHTVTYLLSVGSGVGGTLNNTVTLTYGSGVKGDATTTLTALALTDGAPALGPAGAVLDASSSISMDFAAATTRASQYLVTLTAIETTALASPATVNVSLSGDAGLTGSAAVAVLASTGSTIKLATAATKTALTNGADTAQTLPTFEITEIFPADFSDGETITIVAPTGMVFTAAGATTSSDGGAVIAANTLNGSGSEMTITITTAGPGATAETLSIAGMAARSTSSAAIGDLSITAGKSITGESPNAPFATLAVATGNAVGTVTVSGPTTAAKVGAGTAGNTGAINLSESTYGAIATNSNFPFIQIAPPAGITITGVTLTTVLNGLVLGAPTTAVPADGTWVVPVTTESAAKSGATAPHVITVTYSVGSTVASGTAVTFTLGGDTNVSGTATVANVVDTTATTSTGVIPDQESSIDFVAAGTLQVKEEFAAALSGAGVNFRIIAPTGITFASTQAAPTAPVATVSVDTTFSANDTLLITLTPTAGTDTITVTPNVFIAGTAAAGFNTFTVADGNTNDTNGAGVTAGSADILYVGTVASPDAGADISVGVGVTVNRTVTGGLADLTAASADAGVASETISGSVVSITGVSAGATTVTVTDALGVTDVLAVTVVATTPPAVTTAASDGSTTTASISGGISTDNGTTFATGGTVSVGDAISIIATIAVDAADVGEELDLLVAVMDNASGDILLIDSNGALVPVADPLAAFDTRTLAATETVDVLGGSFTLTSAESGLDLSIYVGYVRADGVVIFNSDAIPLVVQ